MIIVGCLCWTYVIPVLKHLSNVTSLAQPLKLENLDDPVIRFFFTGGIYVTVSFLGVIGSPIAF